MFDVVHTTGGSKTSVNINSVNGIIAKSSPKSKFTRFHMKSQYAERFLNEEGGYRIKKDIYGCEVRIQITVLQVMLCGEGELLVEYLDIEEED